MQNANKSWWRDVKMYRSKDVPWRVKQKDGGTRLQCVLLRERMLVLESCHCGQN